FINYYLFQPSFLISAAGLLKLKQKKGNGL
ncbi:unnamed protein product, partial [marine sediment metagenome]